MFLAPEDSAQRCQIQQIAFVGADNKAYVRHQQHDHDLQKAAQGAVGEAVANHQGKQICAEDAQNTANHRPNQPLQAHSQQAPFKNDNCQSE